MKITQDIKVTAACDLRDIKGNGYCAECGEWRMGGDVRLAATTHRCGSCGAYAVHGLTAIVTGDAS